MTARIFQPARSATQSGTGRSQDWILEFERAEPRDVDPLMGWIGSGDTSGQVRLTFPSKDEAVAYAERNGLAFTVSEPAVHKPQRKAYSDNFKYGKIDRWTH
jgi:ETC complex I subunit conserved region